MSEVIEVDVNQYCPICGHLYGFKYEDRPECEACNQPVDKVAIIPLVPVSKDEFIKMYPVDADKEEAAGFGIAYCPSPDQLGYKDKEDK